MSLLRSSFLRLFGTSSDGLSSPSRTQMTGLSRHVRSTQWPSCICFCVCWVLIYLHNSALIWKRQRAISPHEILGHSGSGEDESKLEKRAGGCIIFQGFMARGRSDFLFATTSFHRHTLIYTPYGRLTAKAQQKLDSMIGECWEKIQRKTALSRIAWARKHSWKQSK